MKVGLRTPSPTKSVKARTTGRIKRTVKSTYNPVYGKNGIGYLKDPERAIKNKVYHKVTIDPLDSVKNEMNYDYGPRKKRVGLLILFLLCAFVCFGYAFYYDLNYKDFHALPVLLGGLFIVIGVIVF